MANEAKQTRVRRVDIVGLGIDANGDIAGTVTIQGQAPFNLAACPTATIEKIIAYGVTQLVNDATALGAKATEADKAAALAEVHGQFLSGDWKATRTGSGITMQSVCVDMVKAVAKAKGAALPAETLKAKVTAILAEGEDGANFRKVKAEYERRLAEAEGLTIDL